MKQSSLGLDPNTRKTRKREFLEQMSCVVPSAELVAVTAPYHPKGQMGRPPFSLESVLRVHFMQQWFGLSDLAMADEFFDTPLFHQFAQFSEYVRVSNESTILRFRYRLDKHNLFKTINDCLRQRDLMLRSGTLVDTAPSSVKNKAAQRDPEMPSSQKGKQWYFGMKAHIGVDVGFGLVHSVRGTAGNVADVSEGNTLLHGGESVVLADAGYQGIEKCHDAKPDVRWHVSMHSGKQKKLDKSKPLDAIIDKIETLQADIRARVEYSFRVIKCQFGFVKVGYRELMKGSQQLNTLFVLSNLWMVRKQPGMQV